MFREYVFPFTTAQHQQASEPIVDVFEFQQQGELHTMEATYTTESEEHADTDADSPGTADQDAQDQVASDSDTYEDVPDTYDPLEVPAPTTDHTVAPDIAAQANPPGRDAPTLQEQIASAPHPTMLNR